MKLISMTDFVLGQSKLKFTNSGRWDEARWYNSLKYANFLKQPLTLGMFVPCDENGNILEEPLPIHTYRLEVEDYEYDDNEVLQYQQAQSKVIFDGFECVEMFKRDKVITFKGVINVFYWRYEHQSWKISKGIKTIEDLIRYNLDLTGSF